MKIEPIKCPQCDADIRMSDITYTGTETIAKCSYCDTLLHLSGVSIKQDEEKKEPEKKVYIYTQTKKEQEESRGIYTFTKIFIISTFISAFLLLLLIPVLSTPVLLIFGGIECYLIPTAFYYSLEWSAATSYYNRMKENEEKNYN